MRFAVLGVLALLTLPISAAAHGPAAHDAGGCEMVTYQDAEYTVCTYNAAKTDIRLFLNDSEGNPYGSFNAVNAALAKNGERLSFAMNGGMYHKDRSPVGGFAKDRVDVSANNRNKGPGNFHMLPNGVFWISEENEGSEIAPDLVHDAFVDETEKYEVTAHYVRDLTQSGPMLVIDGNLHPKFLKGSDSRKIRNGVGRTNGGEILFVKSEMPVNFHSFASLFKDHLKTPNALYLDGTISRLYSDNLGRNDFGVPMGPIIGVVERKNTATAQYIANEAVLITQGETKVMFDPLPLSGFGVYPEPAQADIDAMMAGQGVYTGVDVVFISHAHRDHFSAAKVIAYLKAQANVWLVAPKQALDMMEGDPNWDANLLLRMRIVDMAAGDAPEVISIGDVTATAVRIPHAGWPAPERASVQNMVYRVTLDGGATVMHMGDADPRKQHYTPHADHWAAQRTDTAYPPYWFLTSDIGRSILSDEMNVAASVSIHVPIKVPADLAASGQEYFSKSGETKPITQEHAHD